MQPSSAAILLPAMCQLGAGCTDGREVNQSHYPQGVPGPVGETDVFTAGKSRYNSDTVVGGICLWKTSQRRHLRWT